MLLLTETILLLIYKTQQCHIGHCCHFVLLLYLFAAIFFYVVASCFHTFFSFDGDGVSRYNFPITRMPEEEEETFLAVPSLFKLLKLSLPAAFSTNTEVSVLDA